MIPHFYMEAKLGLRRTKILINSSSGNYIPVKCTRAYKIKYEDTRKMLNINQ